MYRLDVGIGSISYPMGAALLLPENYVPEPDVYVLLATGAVSLLLRVWRRRRAA